MNDEMDSEETEMSDDGMDSEETEMSDDEAMDGNTESADTTSEQTPGFGAVLAVIALVAAALLATRRND